MNKIVERQLYSLTPADSGHKSFLVFIIYRTCVMMKLEHNVIKAEQEKIGRSHYDYLRYIFLLYRLDKHIHIYNFPKKLNNSNM